MQNTYMRLLDEQRQQAWNQAKAILDTADREKRELTAEEDAAYVRVSADLDALDARLKAEQERAQRDARTAATFEQLRGQPVEGRMASAENAMLADEFRNRIRTRSREPIEISFADARS
ncbi:hypothetical protein, partial [Actinomadura chokoriensis]|uniref:hypothetical protein n=1 Tax=Actinomadura chokoriensis TaxID=454156 RepID=UPI0031F96C81